MSAEADTPGKTTLVERESFAAGDPEVPGKSTLVQCTYGVAPDPGAMRRAFLASVAALASSSASGGGGAAASPPDLHTAAVHLESELDGETAPGEGPSRGLDGALPDWEIAGAEADAARDELEMTPDASIDGEVKRRPPG